MESCSITKKAYGNYSFFNPNQPSYAVPKWKNNILEEQESIQTNRLEYEELKVPEVSDNTDSRMVFYPEAFKFHSIGFSWTIDVSVA